MSNGLKEGKALPPSDAKLPLPDNQFDDDLATLDAEFDRAFDALDAELVELQRDLERDLSGGLDPEITQLADALLGPVLLENAESLRGIYQGPEGEAHYQQLLSSISEQHSGAADAESPLPSPLATLSTPPRIDALSQPADAESGYGEDPSKSLPPTISAMSDDGFHKWFVLHTRYQTRAIALDEAQILYEQALKLCGPQSRYPDADYVSPFKADRDQLQREVDDLRTQIEALNQDTNGAASRPGPGGSSPQSPTPPGQSPGAPGSGGPGALPPFGNPPQSGGNNPTNPDRQNTADAESGYGEDPFKSLPPMVSPMSSVNYQKELRLRERYYYAQLRLHDAEYAYNSHVQTFGPESRFHDPKRVAKLLADRDEWRNQLNDLRKQLEALNPDTNGPTSRRSSGSSPQSPTTPGQSPSGPGSGGPGAIPPFGSPPHGGGNNPTNPDQQNTTEPKTERQLRAPSPSSSPQREATPETAEDPTQPLPPPPPYNSGLDFNTYYEQQKRWRDCDFARQMVLHEMKNHADYVKSFGVSHRFVAEAEARLKRRQLEFAKLRQKLREVLPDTPGPTAQPPGGSSPQSPDQSQRPPGQPPVKPPLGGGNTAADTERLVRPPSAQPPVAPPAAEPPQTPQAATPQAQPRPGADLRNVAERHRPPYTDRGTPPGTTRSQQDVVNSLIDMEGVNLGGFQDQQLLEKALYCINEDLLNVLARSGYKFAPGRYNVAQGMPDIHGRGVVGASSSDQANGIHASSKRIVVRTWMEDGQLQLNLPTLMHEVGHAVFETLLQNYPGTLAKFKATYAAEKDSMHRDYFKTEREFLAETFSMFCLKPDELKSKCPETYFELRALFPDFHTYDNGGGRSLFRVRGDLVGRDHEYWLYKTMRPAVLEEGKPMGALELLSRVEALNAARIAKGISPESKVFFIDGEELAVDAVMKSLGHQLCMQRAQRAPFNELEGTITITQAILNDPPSLFKHLSGGLGAILYIPAELSVAPNHPFCVAFREFCKRNNGMYHLALGNRGRESEKFAEELSDTIIHFSKATIELQPLDRFKLVELTRRIATQNEYTLPQESVDKLLEQLQLGGTYRDAYRIWQKVQQAYVSRMAETDSVSSDVNYITPADIESAKIVQERDPLAKLESQFALQEAALQKTREIIAAAKLNRRSPDPQPLALVFEGNPGTGKTSFTRLFAQALAVNRVVDSATPTFLTASELVAMGTTAAKKKFEEGKNGIIFIDEAHQLDPNNSSDGKKIIDLLIPILTNPEYAKTVFVFAGYPGKMDAMLSADPGFKSRTQTISFRDYTNDELRDIAVKTLAANNVTCSDDTLKALMQRIDRMQRATENPGNARDVAKTIESVLRTQAARLARLPSDQVTDDAQRTIELQDVVDPNQVTPASVLDEIERTIHGNQELKDFLRSVEKRVQANLRKGDPIYKNVTFEIALDGSSGTGKTTIVAPLITKYYAALGLIGGEKLTVKTGANLVGRFLGQAAGEVAAAFTAAKGGALLIDEASSLTNAHSYSDDAIKELLTQINANRQKPQMLLFVADYPDNIDRFMAADQGLGSRFRKRIHIEKLSAEGASAKMKALADENDCTFEDGSDSTLSDGLKRLTALPAFASGRDIENLWAELFTEADENLVISKASIKHHIDELIKDVSKRPPPKGASKEKSDAGIATATQTQQAAAQQPKTATETKSRQELLDAQAKVAQKFKDLANSDDAAMADMIADPQSDYYKELGQELNVTPEEALEIRREILEEIVEEAKEKKLKFDYECPFCGGVNSMGCSYFSNSEMVKPDSFRYSTEWLMQNSRKPPYEVEE